MEIVRPMGRPVLKVIGLMGTVRPMDRLVRKGIGLMEIGRLVRKVEVLVVHVRVEMHRVVLDAL
jgi:hypothetical protein